jgi:hypothetical protein
MSIPFGVDRGIYAFIGLAQLRDRLGHPIALERQATRRENKRSGLVATQSVKYR